MEHCSTFQSARLLFIWRVSRVSQALPSHSVDVMISEEQIQRRVQEMGEAIQRDFPDPTEPLLLVGVLKGAALFLADLVRCIDRPVEFDFVAISSYGAATQTSGEVRILKDLDASVAGKHVLIVEDIIDTGLTLRFSYLIESLRARHARSVGVCVLLDKPARRRVEVTVNYRGFEIPDRFCHRIWYGLCGRAIAVCATGISVDPDHQMPGSEETQAGEKDDGIGAIQAP